MNSHAFSLRLRESFARIPQPKKILVAVSGGVDSIVLLHVLHQLKLSCPIAVIHFNHKLRGHQSDKDAHYVKKISEQLGLRCEVVSARWSKPQVSQADARAFRQEEIEKRLSPDTIVALAHHMDDQAETLLLRLLRGSGARGLRGMKEWRRPFWRPLLPFSKEEILAFAKEKKLSWREDASNRSTKYERNWLRLSLMPQMENRRPGFARRLSNLAQEMQQIKLRKPKAPKIDFAYGQLFYRKKLLLFSNRQLSVFLGLQHRHAEALGSLLLRGAGQTDAEGCSFILSRNILWRRPHECKDKDFTGHIEQDSWRSLLGEWHFTYIPSSLTSCRQKSPDCKELFRRRRVPQFMMSGVPCFRHGRKVICLLPPDLSRAYRWSGGCEFTPSILAKKIFANLDH